MIWFACKQCGKQHSRDEYLVGTLVFCECGRGNRVPWSSTVAEPEEALPLSPSQPRAAALDFDKKRPKSDESEKRRAREKRCIDPAYCLNHEETPKKVICEACRCSFCSDCVVILQGQTLCGPCKNFRIGSLSRPTSLLPLAIVAFILGLVSIVVSMILTIAAVFASVVGEPGVLVAIVCCLIAVVLACGELFVGWLALRQIDRQPKFGGRSLATTGATAGLAGIVWALGVAVFSIARQLQG